MIRTTCLGCGKSFRDCVCNTTLTDWETYTGTPPKSPMDTDLVERVKSMRNRYAGILLLCQAYGKDTIQGIIHTYLEDAGYSTQLIMETHCAEKDA